MESFRFSKRQLTAAERSPTYWGVLIYRSGRDTTRGPMKSMAPNFFSTLLELSLHMGVRIVADVPLNLGTKVIAVIPSQL